jgi:photosystem II stability/assembly factor-like uncharacterized protein
MKSIFAFFTVVLFLFSNFSTLTGQDNLVALNGPAGVGFIQGIVSDNTGKIFLANKNFILTSIDNGYTWIECMDGLFSGAQEQKLIVSSSGDVFLRQKRINGSLYQYLSSSNSWQLLHEGLNLYEIDKQGNFWAYSGSELNKFLTSLNSGVTFQEVQGVSGLSNIHCLKLVPYNNEHNLFYTLDNYVYHFTSNGTFQQVLHTNYTPLFLGFNPYTGTAFESDFGKSRRSTDGGLTWQDFELDPTFHYTISKFLFKSNGEIFVQATTGVFVSIDDGLTWNKKQIFDGIIGELFQVQDLLFKSSNCGESDFELSMNEGNTWSDLSTTIKKPTVQTINTDENGKIYALTCRRNAYQVSENQGASWSDYDIFQDSVSVNQISIRQDGLSLAIGNDELLYRRTSSSGDWLPLTTINQSALLRLEVNKSGHFYCFTAYNSYRSIDGGDSWQALGTNIFNSYTDMSFLPNGDILYLSNFQLYLYKINSGVNQDLKIFLDQSIPYDFNTSHASISGSMFISATESQFNGKSAFYRIEDVNQVWTPIPFFDQKKVTLVTTNAVGSVFVVADSAIYRSNDDGITWSIYDYLTNPNPKNISCTTDNYLYLGYEGDVIYRSNMPTTESNYILGNSWLDLNNNCQKDQVETPTSYTKVKATGNNDYIGFVRPNGSYTVNVSAGNYQVNVLPPNALYAPCNADATVVLDATHDSVGVDMPLRVVEFCPYLSVNLSTPFLRRCFENTYSIQYKNEGTAMAQNAYIEITLDSLLEFNDSSLPIFSQNGHVYTFQVGNLDVNQSGTFWLKTKVSCLAELGQTHCISANIFPDAPCGTPLVNRNITEECRENIGAFDPNDKRSFVNGKENPSNILQNTEIEYFIRFQNTGTDTAFRVVVEDRISGLLDLSTLRPLVSSHPFSIEIKDQRTVRFVFDHIMLPDSNVNEAASHGFIKFRITQMPDLANGEVISNLANIFFDFNAPVRTNTSNIMVGITNTYTPSKNYQVSAYPNPFNDQISFEISTKHLINSRMTLSIVDVLGKQILREEFIGDNHNTVVSELQKGIYFYKIENSNGVIGTGKLMKM